jgi:hypothetical protein
MRLIFLLSMVFAIAGCGARQSGTLGYYSRVVFDSDLVTEHRDRLRIGIQRAGLTVVDAAEAERSPDQTLRCQAEITEGGIRSVIVMRLLDYKTRALVWDGRWSRKIINTTPRVIRVATEALADDYQEKRPPTAAK